MNKLGIQEFVCPATCAEFAECGTDRKNQIDIVTL